MPARSIPKYIPHQVVGNRLFTLAPRRFRRKVDAWKHTSERERSRTEGLPAAMKILTWNVNFVWSWPDDRLNCILRYIQTDIIKEKDGRPEPCCLLLQEVHQKSLKVILKNDWIMENFVIVPGEKEEFAEFWVHGNVTLVTKDIPMVRATMLEFSANTEMGRNAVFVELRLSCAIEEETAMLRVVNTHLESLDVGLEYRARQIALIRKYLNTLPPMPTVIGGDMNCLTERDEDALRDIGGFKDAWYKTEEDDDGETWGFQEGPRGRGQYRPARLDRILFEDTDGRDYYVSRPRVRGKGLQWNEKADWATDHYGLLATVKMLAPSGPEAVHVPMPSAT